MMTQWKDNKISIKLDKLFILFIGLASLPPPSIFVKEFSKLSQNVAGCHKNRGQLINDIQ